MSELLSNGGFEDGPGAWTLSPAATVVKDSSKAYAGERYLQIFIPGATKPQGLIQSERFTVPTNRLMRWSFRLAVDTDKPPIAGARITALLNPVSGPLTLLHNKTYTQSTDYIEITNQINVPALYFQPRVEITITNLAPSSQDHTWRLDAFTFAMVTASLTLPETGQDPPPHRFKRWFKDPISGSLVREDKALLDNAGVLTARDTIDLPGRDDFLSVWEPPLERDPPEP